MTRRGGSRLVGFTALAALGLLGALASRRPELAVAAAPFALVLAFGLKLARDPEVATELVLPTERTIEGAGIDATVHVTSARAVELLELLAELPREVEVVDGPPTRAVRLHAGEERDLALELRCTTWGSFELGKVRVRARDLFRLEIGRAHV